MLWLFLGVVVWRGVHLFPSLGRGLRSLLIANFGDTAYKIGFSAVVIASIALMVIGWRMTDPIAVYEPPAWGGPVATVLMILGFLLFGAAKYPTVIKRFIRHPQLTGMAVWAVAHLIANGDSRSLVLFGGLGIWALLEMPLINAREGEWVKSEAPPVGVEFRGVAMSIAIFAVAFLLHPYFSGVSPIPH